MGLKVKIRGAQGILAYALLIVVVVGSLISLQNYLKRGLQGKYHDLGDQFGDQYSPGLTKYHVVYNRTETKRNDRIKGSQTTTMDEYNVKPLHKEVWPVNYDLQWR